MGPTLALGRRMKRSHSVLSLVFLAVFHLPATIPTARGDTPEARDPVEKAPLILAQGEQRLLRVPGLVRYSLGSAVVRILPTARENLLLKAVSPGAGDLWIWKADGSTEHHLIQIEKLPADFRRPALEKALGRLQEAEVLILGNGVVLRGEIRRLSELAAIQALLRAFPKEIDDQTEPSEELLERSRVRVQGWLDASPFRKKLKLERTGKLLLVTGSLDRTADAEGALRQARALYPLIRSQIAALSDDAPTVHFKVFLLELRKSRFRRLGLGWPGTQEGAFRVTTSGIQDLVGLDLALEALEGEGSARILSNPELVVRAPGEAELFSGGELPIRSENRFGSSTTWKNFGLTLQLKVSQTTAERVRLDINTEISHLDPSISTNDKTPGLQANRMKTQVDARYGVPLLLSGLLQQGTRNQLRGLPFLKDIPVLGSLFGSKDYLEERSELVAILLPSLAPPEPPPASQLGLHVPKGLLPFAREWMSPDDERALRASADYPWNALR